MQGDLGPGAAGNTTTTAAAATAAPPSPPGGTDVSLADMDPFAIASAAFAETSPAPPEPAAEGTGESAEAAAAATPEPAAASQEAAPEASDELATLRAENERLRAAQSEQQAPAPEVTALRRFVGLEPIHDGGPTLADLAAAVDARNYAALNAMRRPDGTNGYSLEEAIDLKRDLEGRSALMGQSAGLFHGMAWSAIGGAFDEQIKALGLDGAALSEQARQAGNPLATTGVYLNAIVDAARKAGREEGAKEWRGKHDGLHSELEALKVSRAGSAAALESGGRGSNGFRGTAALSALPDDEFVERAIRGEFAGLDLRG